MIHSLVIWTTLMRIITKEGRKVVNDESHSGNDKTSTSREDVNVSVLHSTEFTEEVKLQDFFFGNK